MMDKSDHDVALRQLAADLLVLHVCVVQILVDRMREKGDVDRALREFSNRADELMALVSRKEGTPGEFVQMLATERLAKLIDNVKELIKVE
jgi:hypothetical protein